MIYVGLSTHYSKAKDLVDEILLCSISPMLYSIQQTTWLYGIDPHTKKKLQNTSRWDLACKQVHLSLKNFTDDVLCTEKVNNTFLKDTGLDFTKFIATSKLDPILHLDHTLDLDYEFTEEKFDREINSKLSKKDVIIFNTEHNWQQIMDMLGIETPQPFWIIKRMILDGYELKTAWRELHELYEQENSVKVDRLIAEGVKRFDLDSIFENRPELYLGFCNHLGLETRADCFIDITQNYRNVKYIQRINTLYRIFQT